MPVRSSHYQPPRLLTGGHVQTLFATLARRLSFRYNYRERIDTPDGDFLDLDWAKTAAPAPYGTKRREAAIVTHGLEGSTERSYMRGMTHALVRTGWDVCAWNLRGCSGVPNRQVATYHSGKTEDLATVVRHVLKNGYDRVVLVGFSLGGNMTLKYLAERNAPPVRRAAVFSVPVDLSAAADQISAPTNIHYTLYFLRALRATVRAKANQHPDAVRLAPLRQIRTLRDFDDMYTAPLNGFRDAAEYYKQASSIPHLHAITTPTLLVNAANDPFLPDACYPTDIAAGHPHLTLEIPSSGGHVGFVDFHPSGTYWSERRAAAFLADSP